MKIFYHRGVGFCIGKTLRPKPGEKNYWNFNLKRWEVYAIDCWEKDLGVLLEKCRPNIKIVAPHKITLYLSHLD